MSSAETDSTSNDAGSAADTPSIYGIGLSEYFLSDPSPYTLSALRYFTDFRGVRHCY